MAGVIVDLHLSKRHGPLPGPNSDARMDFLNADIKEYYKVNKASTSRLPKLLHSNIVEPSGWAELHGPLVKASNTRHTLPYCLALQESVPFKLRPRQKTSTLWWWCAACMKCTPLSTITCTFLARPPYDIFVATVVHSGFIGNGFGGSCTGLSGQTLQTEAEAPLCSCASRVASRTHQPGARAGPHCNESMVGELTKIYKTTLIGPSGKAGHKVLRKYCLGVLPDWTK